MPCKGVVVNASAPPPALDLPRPPFLERMGIWYLRALSREARRHAATDPVHVLNATERSELRRHPAGRDHPRLCGGGRVDHRERGGRGLRHARPRRPPTATPRAPWVFWGVVGGATAIASIIEILYLYWDGLRAVHGLATAAGLDLFPQGDAGLRVASAMARAALELPNSPERMHGIDPRREASRTRLLLVSLIYKLKVSVTNFVVKALVRRVLGRAMVRTWLPFVAVPVTAAWNGWVCWFILREARIRAMGASAAEEMIGQLFRDAPTPPTDAQREAILRAVAATIVRTEDLHPNLIAVLDAVRRSLAVEAQPVAGLDDSAGFLTCLRALPPEAQPLVLRVLGVAAIIDGRMTGAELRLWREAQVAAGRSPDEQPLRALLAAFIQGDHVPARLISQLA